MMTLKHALNFRSSLRTSMATRLAAGVVAVHGGAHLVGTQVAFEAARDGSSVDYLGGALELTGSSLWLAGSMWAGLAAAFIAVAIAMWFDRLAWRAPLVVLATASFAACVLGLWAAWIGIVVNVGIVGFVTVRAQTP